VVTRIELVLPQEFIQWGFDVPMIALGEVDNDPHPTTMDLCGRSVLFGAPSLTSTGKNGCLTHK